MSNVITKDQLESYKLFLLREEKSPATIEKYSRDIDKFYRFLAADKLIEKERVLAFKNHLVKHYKPASVNSMLAAVNGLLAWNGNEHCKVKQLNIQRQSFSAQEKELSATEYARLLKAAEKNGQKRLTLLMQTICATGIRVSELPFITVEALSAGQAIVHCKNKIRVVLLPRKLVRMLSCYIKKQGIINGPVFVSRHGTSLGRSYIWAEMKRLSHQAAVAPGKVFPHNLRHLFARTYYQKQKDIVRLADVLGHSSINTTRIYTLETTTEHVSWLENLGLIMSG